MALAVLLLLGLFWSLVYCQTFPYVSFMGQTLANHAYVDLSEVGNDLSGSDSVQCITDLSTCCSSAHGAHRGDWYFPNETRLHFYWNIRESRGDQSVFLRHQPDTPNSPTGIYLCDIPTIAVYDDRDISVRDTIYVGLYTGSGGSVSIAGGVTYDSNTQTLTCISTGGPATTVTWTRDSTTVTQGTNTVLNDPVTAQYTHTLTVTTAGEYTCTVANNKPSSASASTVVGGPPSPTDVSAVQSGPTSITVTWTPPDPLDGITGYTISYTGSGSEAVRGGNTMSHTLTGLTNGQTYTISIVATTNELNGLSSAPVQVTVGLVPSAPVLDSTPTVTATTVTITGSVPSGSVVTDYVVQWQRDSSLVCPDLNDDGSITETSSSFTGHTITGLEPDNRYTITVTFYNGAGSGPISNAVTAMTTATAPSGALGPITLVTVTPNSATVQWGEVPCPQRNGEITDYTVTVTNSGGMEEGTAIVDVDARQATISGLNTSTQYTVSVAAVNSAGTGPTTTLAVETLDLVVGLERTSYAVSEPEEAVEICITAVGGSTPCPITQSFQVTLSTTDESAVSPSDYEAVSEVLTFAPCDTQHCVNVSIIDDLVNEPKEETFSISLNKISSFVTLSTAAREVLITDDDGKPEEVRFLLVDATAVRISWSGSVHLPTSIIYTVYCSTTVVKKNERVYPPGVTSADVALEDDIILTCTSYVHNFTLYYGDVIPSPGNNPSTLTTFTFDIDKVYLQIQFGPFYYCLSWEFKKVAAIIERELQSYVVEIIRNSCSECYNLTQSFFRKGVFVCHGNPTKTTYRTTLVNPFPTTNSTHLVRIIQSWVSTGPSLVLDGLLVRVSPSCPTSISSLDEEECETGTRYDPGLGERITQTLNVCAVRNLGEEICSLGGCPLPSG